MLRLGAAPRLLRGGRECRQFTDVARVVLDDDGGFEVRRDLLEAVDRSQCRCVVGVECGHTVVFVIFPEVLEIATEQHVAHLSQPDQQAVMAGRMSRRVQHDDGAVAEHVLVGRERFDLAFAFDPILKRLENAGWVESRWEDGDPRDLGRPRRRFYKITGVGISEVESALREVVLPLKEVAWV